jgi:hypothetical protein
VGLCFYLYFCFLQGLKNYYFILGIPIYAREADIKSAYRKLALQFHPDRNPSPDAASIFREIKEAYEVLSDPQRKWLYDNRLKGAEEPIADTPATPHRDPRYRPKPPGYVANKNSAKKELLDVMQRYLPYAMITSRITLCFVFILFLDFVLPAKRKAEKVVELYGIYSRYGLTGMQLQASDGNAYELGKNLAGTWKQSDTVVICRSPLLAVPKRVESQSGIVQDKIPVSIYGNFIFFPCIWLVTSLLGVFYKSGVEFRFNLGIVNALLIIFNLIIFLIS